MKLTISKSAGSEEEEGTATSSKSAAQEVAMDNAEQTICGVRLSTFQSPSQLKPPRKIPPRVASRTKTDTNDEDAEEGTSEDDVDLLQIVADRSRGVYHDSPNQRQRLGPDATDISPSEASLTLTGKSTEEKEQKNKPDLTSRPKRSVESENGQNELDEQKVPRPQSPTETASPVIRAASSSARSSGPELETTEESPGVDSRYRSPSGRTLLPGAYRAAPGQDIARTRPSKLPPSEISIDPAASSEFNSGAFSCTMDRGGKDSLGRVSSTGALKSTEFSENIISAVMVDDTDLELNIIEELTRKAARAEVLDVDLETASIVSQKIHQVRRRFCFYGFLLMIFFGLMAVIAFVQVRDKGKEDSDSDSPIVKFDSHSATTLKSIQERGVLMCGFTKREDSVIFNSRYLLAWRDFQAEICRALAAAALGGTPNITIVQVGEAERWDLLANRTIDVLMLGTPSTHHDLYFNMDKDVEASFSTPYIFDGISSAGLPDYVERCADDELHNLKDCRSIKACVLRGSNSENLVQSRFHPSQIVVAEKVIDMYDNFVEGCCNIIVTDHSDERVEVAFRELTNYTGPYALGKTLFSRQPFAIATRRFLELDDGSTYASLEDNPRVWSEFTNWIMHSLIAAEERNITQNTADKFEQTNVFGVNYRNMFRHAISASGNFGEIYARHAEVFVPRAGINRLNQGESGLHYHRSVGDVSHFGPGPLPNGTLERILHRGTLLCGIRLSTNRDFDEPASYVFFNETLGTYQGIDVEYCQALASALFQGRQVLGTSDSQSCHVSLGDPENYNETSSIRTLQYVLLNNSTDAFVKLERGEVDVVAGQRMDLQSDVREPTTGKGYFFSQPYFFGPYMGDNAIGHITDNNRCLMVRQDDYQWNKFVQIVVMSTIYAEEKGIIQSKANDMPVVNLFGSGFKRMMRDVIFEVGSYAELYERTMEHIIPRAGANLLNDGRGAELASMPLM